MGPNWLKDKFDLGVDDIRKIASNACKYSGWQHVDDVCSEVLLRLQCRYDNDHACFESQQDLLDDAWQDAKSCLSHTFRKTRRLQFRDPRELPEPSTRASEDDIGARENREWLLSLLATATPLVREVFRLHCEEMSGKEIARRLGTSESTVSRRLHDAFDLLRQKLSEN